jgi:cyclopropane fatty-acyl-phospholipid synthase-like methyltransferase
MGCALPMIQGAIPALERLARPGAAFLDVGMGAAGGSIAVCRKFPGVRVVGLEPLPLARLEAHAAIDAAGLTDRIEVRAHGIESLSDANKFDAVYVASMFISDALLEQGLARVHRALAPGGVLLLGGFARPEDPRVGATAALRRHLWGGGTRSASDTARLVKAAGFANVGEGPVSGDLAPVFAIKQG